MSEPENDEAWVGVDVGARRYGVAVAEDGALAVPHRTMDSAEVVKDVLALLESLGTSKVVVGWPLDLRGNEGPATRAVEKFVARLERAAERDGVPVEVHRWDERLTTGLADSLLDEAGVRGRKRRKVVDQVAATAILQGFLDERRRGEG